MVSTSETAKTNVPLAGSVYDDAVTDPITGTIFGVLAKPPSPEVLRQIKTRYGETVEITADPQAPTVPSATD
jgi:hypothetical protein